MGFLPAFRKKNEVVAAPVFRTDEARQLAERFENVKNIADPADRLLMLQKVQDEASELVTQEYAIKNRNTLDFSKLIPVMLGSAFVTGAIGFALFGPPGMLLGVVGEIGCIPFVAGYDRAKLKRYDGVFKDYTTACEIMDEAARLGREIIENADVMQLAESPSAVHLFTKFPELKDKFMLAVTIDKVVADKKAKLEAPDLGKVAKPENPRVDL